MRALRLVSVVGGWLLALHGCAAFSGAEDDGAPRDLPPTSDASVDDAERDSSDARADLDSADPCEGALFFDDFEATKPRCGEARVTAAGERLAARDRGMGVDGSTAWRVSLAGVAGGYDGGQPPAGHFLSVVLGVVEPGTATVLRARVRSSCKDMYTSHLAIHCTSADFATPKGADVYPGFLTLSGEVLPGVGKGDFREVPPNASFGDAERWLEVELELRTGSGAFASYRVGDAEVASIKGNQIECPADRPNLVAQFGLFGWEACTAYFDDVRVTVRPPE